MNYRLAVIHWFPLEQYPPSQNLLSYFGDRSEFSVLACSTHNDRSRRAFEHRGVKVVRSTFPGRSLSRFRRLFLSVWFPVFVLWRLMQFRPQIVLYFEPHSCFPVFLYLIFARRCQLFIHYHEYRDHQEFHQPGNRLMAIYHRFERRFLYPRAKWISHTNSDRIRMFLKDNPEVDSLRTRPMPNLPPASWVGVAPCKWPVYGEPLRLVYAGAVSRRDTYIESVVNRILSDRTLAVSLDLFVNNIDSDTHEYLSKITDSRVRFHDGGVDYQALPALLSQFHVGLILYRGNTRNYIYNAPNKLFEYLVCGLDVWYPGVMLGVKPYAREDGWPRVIEVDFENMDSLAKEKLWSREGLPYVPWTETCESQLAMLEAEMRKRTECLVDKTGA